MLQPAVKNDGKPEISGQWYEIMIFGDLQKVHLKGNAPKLLIRIISLNDEEDYIANV